MSDTQDASLLKEYGREFGPGFHPLRLWRDRRAILAQPEIAARPHPPLANSPVRFALSLSLLPILVLGWLVSALVDVAAPERERSGLYDKISAPYVEVLLPELPTQDWKEIDALATSVRASDMPAPAPVLAAEPSRLFRSGKLENLENARRSLRDWLSQVRASSLSADHQTVLIAKALDSAHDFDRINRSVNAFTRSAAEGGPLMQIAGVISLLFAAWLFKQTLSGDPRFVHGARADRFLLYYGSSRMFWFLIPQTLAYGVGSYASAVGSGLLFSNVQAVSTVIWVAALLYLLLHSREMARALCDQATAPRGGGWAVAWRIVVSQVVATLVLMVAFAIILGLSSVGLAMLG